MKRHFFIPVFASWLWAGCHQALLDAKPDQALLVPKTLSDFTALLDNTNTFNFATGMVGIAADEWQITDAGWASLINPQERNSYTWADDVDEGQRSLDWNKPYAQVFYANVVLDGLASVDSAANALEYRRIKGEALFHRGFGFYNLAQLFCAPFLAEQDGTLPGIPIRLEADVNIPSVRGTVAGTYRQILADLHGAAALLPNSAAFKTRPTRAAALSILARAYQSTNRHDEALRYAEEALALHGGLLDFRTLNGGLARPMPVILPHGNEEVIQYYTLHTYGFQSSTAVSPTDERYGLYADGDLRKSLFFTTNNAGLINYRGNYTGNVRWFCGPATDELLLIKAESLARADRREAALATLNSLLVYRHETDRFTPYSIDRVPDVLGLVLAERRKELVGRGLRWTDLRRLNRESGRETVITRALNGETYTLAPGSPRYVFPLPQMDVEVFGLQQNPR